MDEFAVESQTDGAQPESDPRRTLLLPLWRGRYLLLAGLCLGAFGGLLIGVGKPNTYRSAGKLMIRAGAREEVTPEMLVTGNAGGFNSGVRNVVNDELHLLDTPEVYDEVAAAVTPAVILKPYNPGARDDENTSGLLTLFHRWQSWWFARAAASGDIPHPVDDCAQCRHVAGIVLSRDLSVLAEPGSDVITVSYTTHDPELARKVVAAFLDASIARHRKVYETSSALESIDGRLIQSQQDVTASENAFTNFKSECGVFDFENQQRELLTSISVLEGLAAQDRTRLPELQAKNAELTGLLQDMPATLTETIEHNLQPNPDRAILKQRLFSLHEELAAVERKVGGSAQEAEKARADAQQAIAETQAELDKQPEYRDAGPTTRQLPNPRRDRLLQQRDDSAIDLAALEAASTARSAQLGELQARLLRLDGCESKFRSLSSNALQARTRFDSLRSSHERASLMGSMDQLELSNLRRIQDATLPSEKEGPLRGKLLMVGVMLGLLAGAGLAFLKSMFDRRLHDANDVEKFLGLDVIGVVPELHGQPASGQRAARRAAM